MKKSRFTLIELLVVIGIIAVLAGLIIPATGMARTAAKRAACISNQGQVAKLVQQGMRKNDEFLVSGDSYVKDNASSRWDRFLFDKNILLDLKVARCPSIVCSKGSALSGIAETGTVNGGNVQERLQEAYGLVYDVDTTTLSSGSYRGFDMRGSKYMRSFYADNAKATTRSDDACFNIAPNQLIIGGCSAVLTNQDQIQASSIMDMNSSTNSTTIGRPAMVHGDQCNFFFFDGHAESLTKALSLEKFYPLHNSDYTEAFYVATAAEKSKTRGSISNRYEKEADQKWWFDTDAE